MTLKQQYLGIVLSLLVFLKFIWVPTMSWQENVKSQLFLKTGQVQKMKSLVNQSDSIGTQADALRNNLSKADAFWPRVDDADSYRLIAQNEIEAIAKQQKLKVSSYRWEQSENIVTGISKEVLTVRFKGPVKGVVRLMENIEQREQLVQNEFISFNFTKTQVGKPTYTNGVLKIAFYIEMAS